MDRSSYQGHSDPIIIVTLLLVRVEIMDYGMVYRLSFIVIGVSDVVKYVTPHFLFPRSHLKRNTKRNILPVPVYMIKQSINSHQTKFLLYGTHNFHHPHSKSGFYKSD